MKKIFLLLSLIPVLTFSQVQKQWKTTLDNSAIVATDTVLYYIMQTYEFADYSSTYWDAEVIISGHDADDAEITFGGSLAEKYETYRFHSFVHDSLPYVLDTLAIITITNGDTTYSKGFTGGNVKYGKKVPGFKYWKGSNTTGTTKVIVNLYE